MVDNELKLGLPKGRMQDGVFELLGAAGIHVRTTVRNYRPSISFDGVDGKILKPHNIVGMLHAGTRDLGFAGADWVAELGAEMVELLDTRLDPVRLVAAAPEAILTDGQLPERSLVVASEYERLTRQWIDQAGLNASFLRTYGATEVFPPEDADCIVDVTQTGSTLCANQLAVVGELMRSSTRLYASHKAMENPAKRERIEHIVVLLESVLEARRRVLLEVNVDADNLGALVDSLPCMRQPTIAALHGDGGYAVKVAVPRSQVPELIPQIKALGGTDIVVFEPSQIVP